METGCFDGPCPIFIMEGNRRLKMGHFAHCYADFFGIPYLKQAQKSAAKWVPGKAGLMAAAPVS